MEEQIKRAGAFVLAVVLISSVAFGFVKQAKNAWKSRAEFTAPHAEPGAAFLPLKKSLSALRPGLRPSEVRIIYDTDRISSPESRDISEYRFDAQYAMAPYLVSTDPGLPADCILTDARNGSPRLECGAIGP